MGPLLNSLLALVFIICGTAATFIMLELRGAPKDRAINATLIKFHKIFGWIFTCIFLFMIVVMIIKVSDYTGELSPRIVFHIVLSLCLIPLLVVKIVIARRYPRLSQNLINFGPLVLVLAVALSGITAGYYFLHSSDLKYISLAAYDNQILDTSLGRQVVNGKCNKCHSLERVYRAVKNKDEWTRTINEMASLAEPNISPFDIKQSIYFLTTRKNPMENKVNNKPKQVTGKTIMETKCTACHALDRIIQAEKTEDGWKSTIKRMIDHSDDSELLTEQEQKELLKYLINK